MPKGILGGQDAPKYSLRQHRSGRHFAFYGSPAWPIWDPSEPLHGWEEVHAEPGFQVKEWRWCNMGIVHPQTKQGFKANTRVLASRPLWNGSGCPAVWRCTSGPDAPGHADVKDLHVDWYGFRERLWLNINYIIASLMISGIPLTRSSLGPGIWP